MRRAQASSAADVRDVLTSLVSDENAWLYGLIGETVASVGEQSNAAMVLLSVLALVVLHDGEFRGADASKGRRRLPSGDEPGEVVVRLRGGSAADTLGACMLHLVTPRVARRLPSDAVYFSGGVPVSVFTPATTRAAVSVSMPVAYAIDNENAFKLGVAAQVLSPDDCFSVGVVFVLDTRGCIAAYVLPSAKSGSAVQLAGVLFGPHDFRSKLDMPSCMGVTAAASTSDRPAYLLIGSFADSEVVMLDLPTLLACPRDDGTFKIFTHKGYRVDTLTNHSQVRRPIDVGRGVSTATSVAGLLSSVEFAEGRSGVSVASALNLVAVVAEPIPKGGPLALVAVRIKPLDNTGIAALPRTVARRVIDGVKRAGVESPTCSDRSAPSSPSSRTHEPKQLRGLSLIGTFGVHPAMPAGQDLDEPGLPPSIDRLAAERFAVLCCDPSSDGDVWVVATSSILPANAERFGSMEYAARYETPRGFNPLDCAVLPSGTHAAVVGQGLRSTCIYLVDLRPALDRISARFRDVGDIAEPLCLTAAAHNPLNAALSESPGQEDGFAAVSVSDGHWLVVVSQQTGQVTCLPLPLAFQSTASDDVRCQQGSGDAAA